MIEYYIVPRVLLGMMCLEKYISCIKHDVQRPMLYSITSGKYSASNCEFSMECVRVRFASYSKSSYGES